MHYEGLEKEILDELSDGQWHPTYKIRKEVGARVKNSKDFKNKITQSLNSLVDESMIVSGANESFRMLNPILEDWRLQSNSEIIKSKNKQPRYFGGMLEDDGWLLAPLEECDMVHFRMEEMLTSNEIKILIQDDMPHVVIDHATQLIRIFVPVEYPIKEKLLELKANNVSLGIYSVRLEKNLRRRQLNNLPDQYISGLCEYYGKFAKVLLRPYMSSITKHIKEYDDIQQQVYLWVIEAVQRYDAETSIPFAAYLASSLKKWVFNLARESYGRSIADIELKHARTATEFRNENGREATPEELMEVLNISGTAMSKDKLAIATVSNLRNAATIHQEEGDIQIASEQNIEQELEDMVNSTILSAAITQAATETKNSASALLAIYYGTWGGGKINKKLSQYLSLDQIVRNKKRALKIAERILKENE
mgnify:CR=1 FL=1